MLSKGSHVRPPGEKCGEGLTEKSARELGLRPGTAVATGIIDAHAGGLGLLGSTAPNISGDLDSRVGAYYANTYTSSKPRNSTKKRAASDASPIKQN